MTFKHQKQQLNDAIATLSADSTTFNKAVVKQLRKMASDKFAAHVNGDWKVNFINSDHVAESLETGTLEVLLITGDLSVSEDILLGSKSLLYVGGKTRCRYFLRQLEKFTAENKVYFGGGLECTYANLTRGENHMNGPFTLTAMKVSEFNSKQYTGFYATGQVCVGYTKTRRKHLDFNIQTDWRDMHLFLDAKFFDLQYCDDYIERYDVLLKDELFASEHEAWDNYHIQKGMDARLDMRALVTALENGEDVALQRDMAAVQAAIDAGPPPRSERQTLVDTMIEAIKAKDNPELSFAIDWLKDLRIDKQDKRKADPIKLTFADEAVNAKNLTMDYAEVMVVNGDLTISGNIKMNERSLLIVLGKVTCDVFDGSYDTYLLITNGMQAKAANFRYQHMLSYGCGDFAIDCYIGGGGDPWLNILTGSATGEVQIGDLACKKKRFTHHIDFCNAEDLLLDACFNIDPNFKANPSFDRITDEEQADALLSGKELQQFHKDIDAWYDYVDAKSDAFEFDAAKTMTLFCQGKSIVKAETEA